MNFPKLTFNPPSGNLTPSPTARSSRDRTASPKRAPACFSNLEPTQGRTANVDMAFSNFDFTTPTKGGAAPISAATTQPARFAPMSFTSPVKKFSTAETPRLKAGAARLSTTTPLDAPTKTPSPKKVSFADASFQSLTASTPKLARNLSPKSSPSKPAVSDYSVMSITSPTASLVSNDRSPRSDSDSNQQQAESAAEEEGHEDDDEEESQRGVEEAGGFESPSKLDITMADITMVSDFAPSPKKSQQPYTFATIELSEAAKEFSTPFAPESYADFDVTTALAPVPSFARQRARIPRTKQRKPRGIVFEKAIARQVAESLAMEELEAAASFRHIAMKGGLAYALCPRKRQRVAEPTAEDDSEPYWLEDVDESGVINMIEARRVLRNDLKALPAGPSVHEQRRQYHQEVEKYGEPIVPTCGKRNYDGEKKRAYNNGLLTHTIMAPLLAFPMPELSFDWVLETAIRESNRVHGREQPKHRNVRQPIAIFGESDFSVIEEEEEPQSPTAKLPHFPSTATHHSSSSRKTRLARGAANLEAKLATLQSVVEERSPSPLSSPIRPGFTFAMPSFASTLEVTETDHETTEVEHEDEPAAVEVASPMVFFKNRTETSPFKKRKSLPAARRLSFSAPLRRASLPAAGSAQLPVVQDLQDPASGSLVGAPDSSVELHAVQSPLEVDSASAAAAQATPERTPSPSPSPVVVDARENPDIFGSFQDHSGSPIQALASLARVFEEAKKTDMDGKVVVSREGGRLIVRFKVSDEHVALFAQEQEPVEELVDAIDSATEPAIATALSPIRLTTEAEDEKKTADEAKIEAEEEEVAHVPSQTPAPVEEDDDSMVLLRGFLTRHNARKAAMATLPAPVEPAEPAVLSPTPAVEPIAAHSSPDPLASAPILMAATPERNQSIWADTPAFSITSSADRSRSARRASPAVSTGRQPLGSLDVNSPSPKKAKRKADEVDEREASPEKPQPKRQRRAKADIPDAKKATGKASDKSADEDEVAPVTNVRTRRQLAVARGEAPAVTKIPVRNKGMSNIRAGEKDLAALTRQNTRNNKGDAISAEEMLEAIKTAPPKIETRAAAAAAKKNNKSVQWAAQLARSQSEDPSTAPIDSDEARSSSAELSPDEEKQVGKARKARTSTSKIATTKASTAKASTSKAATPKAASTKTAPAKATAAKATKASQSKLATAPKTEGAKVAKTVKKPTAAAKKELGLSANGTPAKRSARTAKK
ncbi:hypothetical protein HER10_EVM0003510 [Colletotrichum scovillei]|uniref:Uncharacterized protein n=1 Tax=Colletotrichum scovillei TaxID=1209932 RepID=A0A9P7QXQ0_9PEZI|nr:uncharacterized protein HER10_EVM0003510 [Colletotrichum scovillei]KAF4780849.1 hypothetical protein HER10_EVM0003510 [Colletotrichum scovillei]KAG7045113.1 hypothetical protein JMJ77_0009201 [Colletotrichum scovillei]KAG7052275.1 hypothetical protein JMJ78_0005296 [Colletotrichum scovillei]KAG7064566.1 hypothetical protein JMJ76_0012329 [Colletotrichum scovillei]